MVYLHFRYLYNEKITYIFRIIRLFRVNELSIISWAEICCHIIFYADSSHIFQICTILSAQFYCICPSPIIELFPVTILCSSWYLPLKRNNTTVVRVVLLYDSPTCLLYWISITARHTHSHSHALAYTPIHTHSHSHALAYTHIHTHTPTQAQSEIK